VETIAITVHVLFGRTQTTWSELCMNYSSLLTASVNISFNRRIVFLHAFEWWLRLLFCLASPFVLHKKKYLYRSTSTAYEWVNVINFWENYLFKNYWQSKTFNHSKLWQHHSCSGFGAYICIFFIYFRCISQIWHGSNWNHSVHPSSLLNDCYLEAANPVFQAVLSAGVVGYVCETNGANWLVLIQCCNVFCDPLISVLAII